ncbi:ProQ/FINO family protein [Halomonas sp. Bachu 37]|uniref:ProQ/FINO family protein n=1 Tax=Halomonas kashgarensis TaxID=3084920 RepID=UPI003216B2AD
MTHNILYLLDDLERRLDEAYAELHDLRRENTALKHRLQERSQSEQFEVETHTARQHEFKHEAGTIDPEVTTDATAISVPPPPAPEPAAATTPSPHALLSQWYERYPQAFFKGHTRPLKVGIHEDLALHEPWSKKLIRRTLANYVNLPRYLKAVKEGAERIDLEGRPAGKVDKEAARHAAEKREQTQRRDGKTAAAKPKGAEQPKWQVTRTSRAEKTTRQKASMHETPVQETSGHEHRGAGDSTREHYSRKPVAIGEESPSEQTLEAKLSALQQKFKGR